MGADVAVKNFEGNLVGLDFFQRLDNGLDRALRAALTTILSALLCAASSESEQIFKRDLRAILQILRFGSLARCSASSRAAFSSSTTLNSRPASGTPFKPRTLTATDGPASLSRWPSSLISARRVRKTHRTG